MFRRFQNRINTGRPGTEPCFPWLFLSFIFGFIAIAAAAKAQIAYLPGWPQITQSPTGRPIYIADIDDDGENELLMMNIGNNVLNALLYAFKSDGTTIPGFPVILGHVFEGDPALFDSNDDGKLELIVSQNRDLYLRDQQGNAIWSIPYNGPIFQSKYHPYHVSVDDLDNDGNPEIVVTCYSGQAIFVFDAQGNLKPGWPVLQPISSNQSASIGDVDHDGQKEIIVTTSRIWCLKPDGANCPGFPIDYPFSSHSKAVLVDIDGDGYREIAFGWEDGNFRILRYDGSLFPGYPILRMTREFAVGDIYRNGGMGAFITWQSLYGYDLASATPLSGFPYTDPMAQYGFSDNKAPNICKVSDDPGLGIVAGASNATGILGDGALFAFNNQGQVVSGFPSSLLFHRELNEGCNVNDVDGNGTADICCGSVNHENNLTAHSTVYCWDSGYPYNLDNVDWAMDGFDLGHTGRWRRLYHISRAGSQLAVGSCTNANPCYLPPDGSLIAVDVTAVREHGGANPEGQDVRYSRTLGCGNYEGPVIDNGDGTYTRMLRAPAADCTTDLHAWVNEFKLADYQQIIFTSGCVAPPPAFSLLNPPDGAVQQPLNITLEWPAVGAFPNQATAYDLYFGPEPDPPYHQGGLTTPYFDLHSLALGTIYYWRVEARNACGITSSPVWSFTTACPVPAPFVNLCPADGATDLPLEVELAWEASAYAEGYKVYLGADSAALALVSAVSGTRHAASGLADGGTYYWQIVARNLCGETPGPVWSFTTGEGECRHCRPVSPP